MTKEPILVVLAAGLASRYGSLKQMERFGPSGETIVDYALYDAIKAGFKKVVFIIRKDFFDEFKEMFEPQLKNKIKISYAFQDLHSHLGSHILPLERKKPFGTAQAIICAADQIDGAFAVVNADDFYGYEAFEKGIEFLTNHIQPNLYGSVAFRLGKTISDNGYVSRGEITADGNNNIAKIQERVKIYPENGKIYYEENDIKHEMDSDTLVSMNFFCFDRNFVELCIQEYANFLDENILDIKSEFFMPSVADKFIQDKIGQIKILPVASKWFGVTYKEDGPLVRENIGQLINEGKYPNNLWNI
ncbi:nucleotidyltransferase family protein [Rhizosphaericola mali]|uniref:Nucleotidyltransferase n=1 Tax=Rhizosphaericola mali TaxID=2545455 RepID=A0A5P2G5G0_9BACT|nr:sugar phosphate nucleotidyltransferase [Rhizosphaericola mali]QES89052.1 nucleotidyltransferase [Rhizosphaericola mali]